MEPTRIHRWWCFFFYPFGSKEHLFSLSNLRFGWQLDSHSLPLNGWFFLVAGFDQYWQSLKYFRYLKDFNNIYKIVLRLWLYSMLSFLFLIILQKEFYGHLSTGDHCVSVYPCIVYIEKKSALLKYYVNICFLSFVRSFGHKWRNIVVDVVSKVI